MPKYCRIQGILHSNLLDGLVHIARNTHKKNSNIKNISTKVLLEGGKYFIFKSYSVHERPLYLFGDSTKIQFIFRRYWAQRTFLHHYKSWHEWCRIQEPEIEYYNNNNQKTDFKQNLFFNIFGGGKE